MRVATPLWARKAKAAEVASIVAAVQSIIRQALGSMGSMGPMGQTLHGFAFDAGAQRACEACEVGGVLIPLAGETYPCETPIPCRPKH